MRTTSTCLALLAALSAGAVRASNPPRSSDPDRAFALPLTPGLQHVVHVRGHRFIPSTVAAQLGDVITFINDDDELDYVYSNRLVVGVELGAKSSTAQALLDVAGRVVITSGRWPAAQLVVQVAPASARVVHARGGVRPRLSRRCPTARC